MVPRLGLAVAALLVVGGAAQCKKHIANSDGKNCWQFGPAALNKGGTCSCLEGYCATQYKKLFGGVGITCRAVVPGSSCYTGVCSKGGWFASTCNQLEKVCMCKSGMSVGKDGKCKMGWWPPCARSADTGGTCDGMSCYSSRGPTQCVQDKCLCKGNTCPENGRCVRPGYCAKNTQGTCGTFGGCSASRGPTTCSKDGSCLCGDGRCAIGGRCVRCNKEPVGMCIVGGCDKKLGPTDCFENKCYCRMNACAVNGTCVDQTRMHASLAAVADQSADVVVERSTVLSDEDADTVSTEVMQVENWEVTLNLAKFAALAGLSIAVVSGGGLLLYRLGKRRGAGHDSARTLPAGTGTELVSSGVRTEDCEVVS